MKYAVVTQSTITQKGLNAVGLACTIRGLTSAVTVYFMIMALIQVTVVASLCMIPLQQQGAVGKSYMTLSDSSAVLTKSTIRLADRITMATVVGQKSK